MEVGLSLNPGHSAYSSTLARLCRMQLFLDCIRRLNDSIFEASDGLVRIYEWGVGRYLPTCIGSSVERRRRNRSPGFLTYLVQGLTPSVVK
jgi:hypothetical protein